jgi:hypothetical protein
MPARCPMRIPTSAPAGPQLHRVESPFMKAERLVVRAVLSLATLLAACTTVSHQSPAQTVTAAASVASPPPLLTAGPPTPTPPLPAEFQDIALIPGRLRGDWSVIGLITNRSTDSVGQVELEVSLFDADDALLASRTVTPALTTLAPGARSPFSARFPGAGLADHARAEVVAYAPIEMSTTIVEVDRLQAFPTDDGRIAVYGLATNTGRQALEVVDLVLMATSSTGAPIALSDPPAGLSLLEPGASAPFAALLDTNDPSVRLQAFSDARPVAISGEQPLSFSGPVQIRVDPQGAPLVIGILHNEGNDWMTADIVVELRRADELIGLGELELPWPIAPGESQPFLLSEFPGLVERLRSEGIEPADLTATAMLDPAGSKKSTSPPVTLEADVTAQEVIEGSLFLKGTVTNDTSTKVDRPSVVAVLRSTEGGVITAGFVIAGAELAAGESLPFTLTLQLPAGADVSMAEFDLRAAGFRSE